MTHWTELLLTKTKVFVINWYKSLHFQLISNRCTAYYVYESTIKGGSIFLRTENFKHCIGLPPVSVSINLKKTFPDLTMCTANMRRNKFTFVTVIVIIPILSEFGNILTNYKI